jgi:hypothetical protein
MPGPPSLIIMREHELQRQEKNTLKVRKKKRVRIEESKTRNPQRCTLSATEPIAVNKLPVAVDYSVPPKLVNY